MYPIRFEPIYKNYIWGGQRISEELGRNVKEDQIAESWEMSDRHEGMSVVANGSLKGKTLNQLVQVMGEQLLGIGQTYDRFPLILKILDARDHSSIQVHPDEQTAIDLKGEPKTEMWVALDEGHVYAGLLQQSDPEEFQKILKSKEPEKLLEKLELKKGDVVYIPGGRLHAVCAGSFLFEVQQNSNTTYRVHDWGRKGRELHLNEAMTAVHWHDRGHAKLTPHHQSSDFHHQWILLGSTPFFVIDKFDIFDRFHIAAIPRTFQAFYCMQGEGSLIADGHKEPLTTGMTYLVPAACKSIEVEGRCELLRIRLP